MSFKAKGFALILGYMEVGIMKADAIVELRKDLKIIEVAKADRKNICEAAIWLERLRYCLELHTESGKAEESRV